MSPKIRKAKASLEDQGHIVLLTPQKVLFQSDQDHNREIFKKAVEATSIFYVQGVSKHQMWSYIKDLAVITDTSLKSLDSISLTQEAPEMNPLQKLQSWFDSRFGYLFTNGNKVEA